MTIAFEPMLNRPVETADSAIEVTPTTANPLLPGVYTFQLIVIDNAGNESAPASLAVTVKDTRKPTAVLELTQPQQQPVEFGSKFTLSGAKSKKDPPGQVAKYRWTLLRQG